MAFVWTKPNLWLVRFEKTLICVLLFSMAGLSFVQVILRLFSTGFMWIETLLRIEVLWVAFVGASLATEFHQHIRIDLLTGFIKKENTRIRVQVISHLFAFFICALLFASCVVYFSFVRMNTTATLFRGIPDWAFQLVIGYCFFVMTIRYALHLVQGIRLLSSGTAGDDRDKADE